MISPQNPPPLWNGNKLLWNQERLILESVDDQLGQLLGDDYFGERERWLGKDELSGMTPGEFLSALQEKRKQALTNKNNNLASTSIL